jgi:hypothetical protein
MVMPARIEESVCADTIESCPKEFAKYVGVQKTRDYQEKLQEGCKKHSTFTTSGVERTAPVSRSYSR